MTILSHIPNWVWIIGGLLTIACGSAALLLVALDSMDKEEMDNFL
jgi:hypothetical protein